LLADGGPGQPTLLLTQFASPTGEGLAIDPFSNYRAWFVGGLQPTR
jgi:hypothetical protein